MTAETGEEDKLINPEGYKNYILSLTNKQAQASTVYTSRRGHFYMHMYSM